MDYRKEDVEKFAELILGKSNTSIPMCACIGEMDMYEFSYDYDINTSLLDEHDFTIRILTNFLCELADKDKFVDFVDYYFNRFLEGKITEISENGYNLFILKDKILFALNTAWSIPEQEFFVDNSKCIIKQVKFTLYNKMGEGGFCTVYKCPYNAEKVYKVLNKAEKGDAGSVHRFKREFNIMNEQNGCGYTVNVYDYDPANLVYTMDRARISLEEYVENKELSEEEKDNIIIRLVDCMEYLHSKEIIHRDFHPGNILKMKDTTWCVTDFGLAKELSSKYSHQTTTTHAVGRAWFTDPIQLFALKDGNYITDMYSLAKTIDYIMNGNMSGASHKYSAIIYKATAPNLENRYNYIDEMKNDIKEIANRPIYESAEEIVKRLIEEHNQKGSFDCVKIISLLDKDTEGFLMTNLIYEMGNVMVNPYCEIRKIAFDVALREIRRVDYTIRHTYPSWDDFDTVAYWAIGVINKCNANDEICIQAAYILEYVASSVDRYRIKTASNKLKNNVAIDGHIRAKLTYHEGY